MQGAVREHSYHPLHTMGLLPLPIRVTQPQNAAGQAMLRLLDARICERVAYRRAVGEGATVAELAKDPQAIAEMAALYKEIQA